MNWKALGYLLAFVTPLLPFCAMYFAVLGLNPNVATYFPLFFLFVLLPMLDYAIGGDRENPSNEQSAVLETEIYYRVLTLLALPIHVAMVIFAARYFVVTPLQLTGQIGWIVSLGVVGGVMAINVAHELIHKNAKWEQTAGGILLSFCCYGGFKIEHLRGHHVHVSTPKDASSAQLGWGLYQFLARAIPRNCKNAFALEAERLRKSGRSAWSVRNEMWWWYGLSAALAVTFYLTLGRFGLVFFIGQAVFAFLSLEIINYVEHYGLQRREVGGGRYERTTHLHSWNSNYLLTNLMLFQLQRHSDHHENAKRRYQALRHYDDSPQLPGGYAAMFVLALFPPLWRAVMDKRVEKFRATLAAE
jgi:alkane 1-monooxygenase